MFIVSIFSWIGSSL